MTLPSTLRMKIPRCARNDLSAPDNRDRAFDARITTRPPRRRSETLHRHVRRNAHIVEALAVRHKPLIRQPESPPVRQRAPQHVREHTLRRLTDSNDLRLSIQQRLRERLRRTDALNPDQLHDRTQETRPV